jgi:hypothetical protein
MTAMNRDILLQGGCGFKKQDRTALQVYDATCVVDL